MLSMGAVETLLLLASIVTAVTVLTIFSKKVFSMIGNVTRFLDDFNGVEERPGHHRQPGFPERIKDLEECMQNVSGKVDSIYDLSSVIKKIENKVVSIEKEVHPNHGTSMRDTIDKIQLRLELVEEKLGVNVRSTN
jgi:hypothetical protein